MPWAKISSEPQRSSHALRTASISSSRVTSQPIVNARGSLPASSSTPDFSRSPAKVMHSSAPASDSFSAIAHDRLRWFATPMTSACFPVRSIGYTVPPAGRACDAARSGDPLRLPHPDGKDDHLDPRELQPALDRECRLGVERAREQILSLEHELPREHDGTAELLDQVETDVLELLDQVGAQRVAVLGVVAHALCERGVFLEVLALLRLELLDVLDALELRGVHEPDGYEHEVLEVTRKQALHRQQRVDAEAGIRLDHDDRGRAVGSELGLHLGLGQRQVRQR